MEKSKEMPTKSIKIVFEDNTYELKYPNTGGLIDIEYNKANIANGKYNEIKNSGTVASDNARFTIDMIATLSVICPELNKNLKMVSLFDLDPLDTKKLLKIYLKEIMPWLNQWQTILSNFDEDEETK